MSDWIPVEEALPEERKVHFTSAKWSSSTSDTVFVAVEWEDGERTVIKGRTIGGKWSLDPYFNDARVVAWMPCPEPYMEDKQ